jgi:hypothetical protein
MYAVGLAVVLVVVRILGSAGHHSLTEWWPPVAYLWHDALLVLLFAGVEVILRGHGRVVRAGYVLVAAYAVINVPVERALWSPLTWPMWRAAGGPIADSIAHYATWSNGTLVAAGLAAVTLAPAIARRVPSGPVLAAALGCAALGFAVSGRMDTQGRERNAWTALAAPLLVRPVAAAAPRDWRASDIPPADEDLSRLRGAAAGRNVVLVSLESTAARYLGVYGAGEDVAPNLTRLARSAVLFENAYAVYPESIKGLFSVLCSRTPAIGLPAERYAGVACRSMAGELAARGYRTALFHSGRFGYLGMEAIIRNRGYNVLNDAGDIGGVRDSSFGIDEPSTVASILRWIDSAPTREPFFVTYLPIAGHHPYETPDRGPFSDGDEFGRYRNALHYGDEALGALRRGLEARGLDRTTLWIVIGDHGEAFGQHAGNYGHTFQLFEENVRVPFLVAAPGLLTGPLRARRIVSLLDTAPTTLDLLGLPLPDDYEGTSMLDRRPRMALFFTDYSLTLAGLRDGSRKIVHDLGSGRTRWYDLERDPEETADLSAQYPDQTRRYVDILRGWVTTRADPRR